MIKREKYLKDKYGDLLNKVRSIINEVDPMNLFPGPPEDEYDPEIAEILGSLSKVDSKEELAHIIKDIFIKWFDLETTEPHSKDIEIAHRIWKLKDKS